MDKMMEDMKKKQDDFMKNSHRRSSTQNYTQIKVNQRYNPADFAPKSQ